MRAKRIAAAFLGCFAFAGILCASVGAVGIEHHMSFSVITGLSTRATGSFNLSIPAYGDAVASNSFPLAAGEIVTIKASYAPFTASMDFGLIAPNGQYRYINVTNGTVDGAIEVEESGNYTLQIKNHSSGTVQVSGFVNY